MCVLACVCERERERDCVYSKLKLQERIMSAVKEIFNGQLTSLCIKPNTSTFWKE
jgi:hypothetical protein